MTIKMYCGGCGVNVTTPNSAGIYPCGKCGSTWRVSNPDLAPLDVTNLKVTYWPTPGG